MSFLTERVNKSRDVPGQGCWCYRRGLKKKMTDFTNANCLIAGYKRVRKASGWKDGNQAFGLNFLKEVRRLQKELRNGNYRQGAGAIFSQCEQGHTRLIKALTVRDTVVQHALCDFVLVPELSQHLIHDNGASLKGKGISFTRKRFEQHMRWHYRRYGREGYILKIDFRKYFDNIRHDILKQSIRRYIEDDTIMDTVSAVLKANEVDISFTDDVRYIDKVFNALEYERIAPTEKTGKRFMAKGLGIGSPLAQISGLFMPTLIDTYCKVVKRLHCYDAYMDDRIIIHPSKAFLKDLLEEVREIAKRLGLHVNNKKTQIIKLSHGFTFLKTRYMLTNSGKILRGIPHDVVTRQRRKMKKLAGFVRAGTFSVKAFDSQYRGWRGDKIRYNASRTLANMDKLYRRLRKWLTKRKPTPSKLKGSTAPRK